MSLVNLDKLYKIFFRFSLCDTHMGPQVLLFYIYLCLTLSLWTCRIYCIIYYSAWYTIPYQTRKYGMYYISSVSVHSTGGIQTLSMPNQSLYRMYWHSDQMALVRSPVLRQCTLLLGLVQPYWRLYGPYWLEAFHITCLFCWSLKL